MVVDQKCVTEIILRKYYGNEQFIETQGDRLGLGETSRLVWAGFRCAQPGQTRLILGLLGTVSGGLVALGSVH